jgi:hypothetical protein
VKNLEYYVVYLAPCTLGLESDILLHTTSTTVRNENQFQHLVRRPLSVQTPISTRITSPFDELQSSFIHDVQHATSRSIERQ